MLATPQPHYAKTVNKGHARLAIRECWVSDAADGLTFIQDYKVRSGLHSPVKITAERHLPTKIESDTRYFISSLPPDPAHLLQLVRSHWQLENAFHWVLDSSFEKMKVAFALTMRRPILRSFVGLLSIYSNTNPRSKLV